MTATPDVEARLRRDRSTAATRPRHRDLGLMLGLLVVLAVTGFRVWSASRTWFYLDDFAIVATMAHEGLTWHALFTPYFGHLMPAGMLAAWLLNLAPPYDYVGIVVEIGLLNLGLGLAALRLFRRLFGPHPALPVLVGYFLLSPWLITPTTWWAAGINHLPALLATVLALGAVVDNLRAARRRTVILSALWIILGLSFAELTLLAYVPMAVLALGYFARGSLLTRAGSLWRTRRNLLLTHMSVVVAYLGLYLWCTLPAARVPAPVPWRGYLINMFGTVVPSGFAGGPSRWHQVWSAQFETNPPILLQLAGLGALATLFGLSAATRVRGLRAWWIPTLQVLAVIGLMAQNRAIFGQTLILDLRFSTPLALGFTLALGLSFLPVQGALETVERRSDHWLVDHRAPGLLAMAVFTVLAVASTISFPLLNLPGRQPRAYFATFERALADHDNPIQLMNRDSPGYVYTGGPAGNTAVLIGGPYGDRVTVPEVVRDGFMAVNYDGDLVRPSLDVVRRLALPTATSAGCSGARLDASGGTIQLDGPVVGYVWRLHVEYDATTRTPAVLTFGGRRVRTVLEAGQHSFELNATAPRMWDSVQVSGLADGASACVTGATLGTVVVPGEPRDGDAPTP